MKQKLLHTPDGVRDIYNAECERKSDLENKISSVFYTYGYRAIETPTFEFFDVFGNEVGTTPSQELYKFFDREGNTLVLRPDFTPSVARAAAKYFMENKDPIRLCYKGNTFINHSNYRGHLKETTQMGVELMGDTSVDADAELIAMVVSALLKAGLKDFQISIGHIQYFETLVARAGIDENTKDELKDLIRNKNSFGVERLLADWEMDEQIRKAFIAMPNLFGGREILAQARELCPGMPMESLERLEKVFDILSLYGYEKYVSADLGMMGNYMYYTGIIFRAYTYGTGDAIVKGGRYDNLLRHFGKDAPSVGFVVVIDELLNALRRQHIDPAGQTERYLIIYDERKRKEAILLAASYRSRNVAVQMYLSRGENSVLSEETMQSFLPERIIRL